MYCVIHKENKKIYYLAWQTPVVFGENGYFWTDFKTFKKCLPTNTKEHPFVFSDKTKAIEILRTYQIPQKCSIVKFKAEIKEPFVTEKDDCPLGGDIANDCADCAYSDEYHFFNGECIARGCEADVCNRGGYAQHDCKYCALKDSHHSVNGKCVSRR